MLPDRLRMHASHLKGTHQSKVPGPQDRRPPRQPPGACSPWMPMFPALRIHPQKAPVPADLSLLRGLPGRPRAIRLRGPARVSRGRKPGSRRSHRPLRLRYLRRQGRPGIQLRQTVRAQSVKRSHPQAQPGTQVPKMSRQIVRVPHNHSLSGRRSNTLGGCTLRQQPRAHPSGPHNRPIM